MSIRKNNPRPWCMRWAVVACGDTIGEQAVAGGAIGAGAAVLTSGSLVQGAAIGAGSELGRLSGRTR